MELMNFILTSILLLIVTPITVMLFILNYELKKSLHNSNRFKTHMK